MDGTWIVEEMHCNHSIIYVLFYAFSNVCLLKFVTKLLFVKLVFMPCCILIVLNNTIRS